MKEFINDYITEGIKQYIEKYEIELIGIASPGEVIEGKITTLVNLGIQQLDIISVIKKICDLPIIIRNDAKCAGLAEKRYGNLRQEEDNVFICLGTGIGGAVFMKNVLLKPKKNTGFELGHMIIQKEGKPCKCGKKGCFETYCSIKRLKDEFIQVLEIPKETTSQELLKILKEKKEEDKIKEKVDTYISDLMIGLSNITDIFEPEAICLGGSFVYFKEILYTKLVEEFEQKCYVFNKQSLPKIKLAMLGNDAGMIGATIE